MSEGEITKVYNKGISEIICVIKELPNEIKSFRANAEALSKDNKKLALF